MSNDKITAALLPCPFCGGNDIKEYSLQDGDERVVYRQCQDCTSVGPDHKNGHDWNRRASPAQAQEPVNPRTGEPWRLTDPEIVPAVEALKREVTSSPEKAREWLVVHGFSNQDGTLPEEYGGPAQAPAPEASALAKTFPERIWLQVGDDCPDDAKFGELDGVTWCQDSQWSNDIAYVRADLAASPEAREALTAERIAELWDAANPHARLMLSDHVERFARAVESHHGIAAPGTEAAPAAQRSAGVMETLAAEVKRLAEDMADKACATEAGDFVAKERAALHAAIDRLAARASLGAPSSEEPVAWQVRIPGSAHWRTTGGKLSDEYIAEKGYEVRALYASPPASSEEQRDAADIPFRLRIARLLAEMNGESVLSEQQCARYVGIDLISWRELVHTFSVGTSFVEGEGDEFPRKTSEDVLRAAMAASTSTKGETT